MQWPDAAVQASTNCLHLVRANWLYHILPVRIRSVSNNAAQVHGLVGQNTP